MNAKLATTRRRSTEHLRHCVRRARNAAGMSREQAGADVGVSADTILNWENGSVEPKWSKLLDAPVMGPLFREELARLLAKGVAA